MDPRDSLLNLPVDGLLEAVSEDSSPVAASAGAALAVAVAAGLTAKAARMSPGWDARSGAAGQAEVLGRRAMDLYPRNARAFGLVSARLDRARQPDHDETTEQRNWQLGVALRLTAELPLATSGVAADVADLASEVAARCDPGARPEAIAAVHLVVAAVRIGELLVAGNLATGAGSEAAVLARELTAHVDRVAADLPAAE